METRQTPNIGINSKIVADFIRIINRIYQSELRWIQNSEFHRNLHFT